jgi:hypothetical protein
MFFSCLDVLLHGAEQFIDVQWFRQDSQKGRAQKP